MSAQTRKLEREARNALAETRRWMDQRKSTDARNAAVVFGVLIDKLAKAKQIEMDEREHKAKIAGQTAQELAEFMQEAFEQFAEMLGIPDRVVREIGASMVRQWVAGEQLAIDREQASRLRAGLLSLWRDEIATELEWEAAQRRREAVSGLSSARTQTGQGSGYGGRKSLSRTPEPERVTPQPQTPEPKETILLGKERHTLTEAELAAREAHIHNNDDYWRR